MTEPGPFRDGAVHVLKDRCSTCIFRPGNLMRLSPGRVKEMTETSQAQGSAITCHQTLPGAGPAPAVCAGYAALPKTQDLEWFRWGVALGVLKYDPVPAKDAP